MECRRQCACGRPFFLLAHEKDQPPTSCPTCRFGIAFAKLPEPPPMGDFVPTGEVITLPLTMPPDPPPAKSKRKRKAKKP